MSWLPNRWSKSVVPFEISYEKDGKAKYEREFILEKHPTRILCVAELPSETLTLEHFIKA